METPPNDPPDQPDDTDPLIDAIRELLGLPVTAIQAANLPSLEDMERYSSFLAWCAEGVSNGWISDPFCATHEAPPLAADEDPDSGECLPSVRIWSSSQWSERKAWAAMQVSGQTPN